MKSSAVMVVLLAVISMTAIAGCGNLAADSTWQEEFNLYERSLVPTGSNRFFVLEPGYQIVLEGGNEKVAITVLDETISVDGVTTRVVEEREWRNGQIIEISRNYFAIDPATEDVFYFGEGVDDYKDGKIVNHGGAWQAGRNNAKPGLIMPGQPAVGMKYYQEVAPNVAMDRAEVVSVEETLKTPAGVFADSLKTLETTPLNRLERSFKTYAPGIGLIQDEKLLLTEFGFLD